jgi:hypothetical protein
MGEQTNGKGANHPADEPALEIPWEAAPAHVAELAASCARFVMAKYKVPLDGTSDTLSLLDQYVREARAEIVVKPETLNLLAASIGAYLGEVLRRAFGGVWYAPPGDEHDAWRVDMTRVFLTFNPLGMAREALTLEEQPGWHAHLETDDAVKDELERRLAALPEVEDEEYYLPSTRFDVVSLAVEALRAKMIADGHADVTFGPEDYRRK